MHPFFQHILYLYQFIILWTFHIEHKSKNIINSADGRGRRADDLQPLPSPAIPHLPARAAPSSLTAKCSLTMAESLPASRLPCPSSFEKICTASILDTGGYPTISRYMISSP